MAIRTEVRDSGGAVTATPVNTVPLEPATGVEQTGDETIDGVKTFLKSPIVPAASAAGHAAQNAQVTHNTGDEVIAGSKKFTGQAIFGGGGAAPGSEPVSTVGAGSGVSMGDRDGVSQRWVLYVNEGLFRIFRNVSGDLITIDGTGKITFVGGAYIGLQSNVATGTADASISNTAYVLLTGMTLTPAAGTYLVWFMSSVESSSVTDAMFVSLFVGGVQVAASEIEDDSKTAGESDPISTLGQVTVNGSQAIEVRWKNNGSATATMHERTLMILRVA